MRVLFYSVYGFITPHFETELELIKEQLEKGHDVFVVKCGKVLDSCMFNPNHFSHVCANCQSRAYTGFKTVGLPSDRLIDLKLFSQVQDITIPFFNNSQELKNYKFQDVDTGLGVFSSLVSQTKAFEIDSYKFKEDIDKNIRMAINVLLNFEKIIPEIQPDTIFIFNGRFADQKPLVRLSQKFNIPFYIHERSGSVNKYELFKDSLLHSPQYVGKEIKKYWKAGKKNKQQISKSWFLDRRNGVDQNWPSFVKDQLKNKLPEGFDSEKRNIVFFNSSEHELIGVEGFENPIFKYQNETIQHILRSFENNQEYHFYLRVHPMLSNFPNPQWDEIRQFDYNNLTIIGPNEPTDSYCLLDACEKVITFGSTMGVEATYWCKPSILIGQSFYSELECAYQPQSIDELDQLIERTIITKPQLGSLKYGYWEAVHGYEFQYFQPIGFFGGKFMGKYVGYDQPMLTVNRIKKVLNYKFMGVIFKASKRLMKWDALFKKWGLFDFVYDYCYSLEKKRFENR